MAGIPPGINLADDESKDIIGAISATWALATIAIGLRFACRRLSRAGFWWDDWLMVPAYIFTSIVSLVSVTWMIEYGLGKHIFAQPPQRIPKAVEVFLKSLFISEVCYTGTIVFAKFSILAFYWRIFKMNDFVRWCVFVITGFVTAWGIAVLIIVVAQCRPLRGFWDKTIPAVCSVDSKKFFYGNSIPNIATDVFLLIAPMPAIWSLKLEMKQKVSLSAIFLLGGFVTSVSITRLVYLVTLDINSPDVTWVFRAPQIWTCVELNIAVVCGCLPQLRPLILLLTTGSAVSGSGAGTAGKQSFGHSGASSGKSKGTFGSMTTGTARSGMVSVTEREADRDSEAEEKRVYSDTRPLVKPNTGGYIELGRLEKGKAGNRMSKVAAGNGSGASGWDINVRTEWDVRTEEEGR